MKEKFIALIESLDCLGKKEGLEFLYNSSWNVTEVVFEFRKVNYKFNFKLELRDLNYRTNDDIFSEIEYKLNESLITPD